MQPYILIPRAGLAESLWSNGAGRKADIAGGPGWHVGFASLEQDAPFSDFAGQDRTITLVEGPGFVLDFPNAHLDVAHLYDPTPFDGGTPTLCRIHGRCTVLNAMTRRNRFAHSVTIAPAADLTCGTSETLFAVVLSGTLTLSDNTTAGLFDTVQVHDHLACAGAGAVLAIIRIVPI